MRAEAGAYILLSGRGVRRITSAPDHQSFVNVIDRPVGTTFKDVLLALVAQSNNTRRLDEMVC